MPTLQDLSAGNQIAENSLQFQQSQAQYSARQQAAAQAADFAKQGDFEGAYGTMISHDPANAATYIKQAAELDPELAKRLQQSQTLGQQLAMNQTGNGAAQVARIKADGMQAKVTASQDKPVKVTLADGTSTFVKPSDYLTSPAQNQDQPAQSAGVKTVPTGMKPEQDLNGAPLTDDSGRPLTITPIQDKDLKKATTQFNKDAKPYTDSITATENSKSVLQNNIAGTAVIEKLNTLKGILGTGRVPAQIVEAYGGQAGIENMIKNGISQAEGKGLSPEMQKNFLQLNQVIQDDAMQNYDALLRNRVGQAVTNSKVDPKVVENRFAAVAPTAYQQSFKQAEDAYDQLKQLPANGDARAKFFGGLSPAVQAIVKQKHFGK